MASDPYDTIAPYYDLGMGAFDDDVALYLGLAERAGGRVLDLGCGTGRLLHPIASAGFKVIGLDRSVSMLERAQQRLAAAGIAAGLLLGSMTCPPLRCGFGLIILAVDTFLHLQHQQDQVDCLRGARRLLDDDGLLILDLPSPSAAGWDDWSPGIRPLVPGLSGLLDDGSRLDKLSSFSADASAQAHHVTEYYDRSSPDGTVRRTVVEYSLRFAFPAELELLLRGAGLKLVDRYGDYNLSEFTEGSERQICVAARDPSGPQAGAP